MDAARVAYVAAWYAGMPAVSRLMPLIETSGAPPELRGAALEAAAAALLQAGVMPSLAASLAQASLHLPPAQQNSLTAAAASSRSALDVATREANRELERALAAQDKDAIRVGYFKAGEAALAGGDHETALNALARCAEYISAPAQAAPVFLVMAEVSLLAANSALALAALARGELVAEVARISAAIEGMVDPEALLAAGAGGGFGGGAPSIPLQAAAPRGGRAPPPPSPSEAAFVARYHAARGLLQLMFSAFPAAGAHLAAVVTAAAAGGFLTPPAGGGAAAAAAAATTRTSGVAITTALPVLGPWPIMCPADAAALLGLLLPATYPRAALQPSAGDGSGAGARLPHGAAAAPLPVLSSALARRIARACPPAGELLTALQAGSFAAAWAGIEALSARLSVDVWFASAASRPPPAPLLSSSSTDSGGSSLLSSGGSIGGGAFGSGGRASGGLVAPTALSTLACQARRCVLASLLAPYTALPAARVAAALGLPLGVAEAELNTFLRTPIGQAAPPPGAARSVRGSAATGHVIVATPLDAAAKHAAGEAAATEALGAYVALAQRFLADPAAAAAAAAAPAPAAASSAAAVPVDAASLSQQLVDAPGPASQPVPNSTAAAAAAAGASQGPGSQPQ